MRVSTAKGQRTRRKKSSDPVKAIGRATQMAPRLISTRSVWLWALAKCGESKGTCLIQQLGPGGETKPMLVMLVMLRGETGDPCLW